MKLVQSVYRQIKINLGSITIIEYQTDSMTNNLRPTHVEATDVANVALHGSYATLLGAETLRGLYPVETVSIVCKICAKAEKVHATIKVKACAISLLLEGLQGNALCKSLFEKHTPKLIIKVDDARKSHILQALYVSIFEIKNFH
ncbi:pyruvate kinase [Artemisia annua]|uniref:Pyruvate kinase n=1 Tax=Artemisia annua TaxID=35608 RepID=A0A2U1KJC8_ARTAN|nr:pyruvate kinase [Artemisia annua]